MSTESAVPAIQMTNVIAGSSIAPLSPVVQDVNWTVHAGEFWAIAGLQGTGKTDFLLMTGGLSAPLAGEYRLFGERMPIFDEARLAHRLKIGLIFEGGQLLHHLSVRDNIALPLKYHYNMPEAEACQHVDKWLEVFELSPWAEYMSGALGRIWQRRASLARALVLRPELLLLDSPLSGMDPPHQAWWLRFMRELWSGHPLVGHPVTVVVTSADMRPWRGLAQQYALLRERRFQVLGDWTQAAAGNHFGDLFMSEAPAAQLT